MAFDSVGFTKAAQQAGYSQDQINQVIKQRTGVRGWLTGGKTGLAGVASAAGNILNIPSYAIGGALNRFQRGVGSQYGKRSTNQGFGEGIREKRGVMTELPETLGVDPTSTAGKVVGFGGELLTPDPIGILGDVGKSAGLFGKASDAGLFARVGRKATKGVKGVSDDVATTLLQKSYKLNDSSINKIAAAIGETNEAKKASSVLNYLENTLGLSGATQKSLRTLDDVIAPVQKQYDNLVKTGNKIPRSDYAQSLLDQAVWLEKFSDDPGNRSIVKKLIDEADFQMKKGGFVTDTDLTRMKTSVFSRSGKGKLSDIYKSSRDEQIGRAGVEALEKYAPGSKEVGQRLSGMRTAQDVIGQRARTGIGSQLINTFKPSALGAGVGATVGATTGRDPLKSGVLGLVGGMAVNNPRVLNIAGKAARKVGAASLPKVSNQALKTGLNIAGQAAKRTPSRAFRVMSTQGQTARTTSPTSQVKTQLRQPTQQVLQQGQSGSVKPYNQRVTPTQKYVKPTAEDFYAEIRKKRGY